MNFTAEQIKEAARVVHGTAPTCAQEFEAARETVRVATNNGWKFSNRGEVLQQPGPTAITGPAGEPLYFYVPIPFYDCQVLKCGGIVSDQNRERLKAENPGGVEVEGYRGDRIKLDDHSEFTSL